MEFYYPAQSNAEAAHTTPDGTLSHNLCKGKAAPQELNGPVSLDHLVLISIEHLASIDHLASLGELQSDEEQTFRTRDALCDGHVPCPNRQHPDHRIDRCYQTVERWRVASWGGFLACTEVSVEQCRERVVWLKICVKMRYSSMTMRKQRQLLIAFAVAGLVIGGCSQTIYDFFPPTQSGGNTGGACITPECAPSSGGNSGDVTSDSGTSEGGNGATTSNTSSGETGYAGEPMEEEPLDSCTSVALPGEALYMLRFTQSGNCLGRGAFTTLGTDPGYLIETHACTRRPRDAWVPVDQGGGAFSYRNESVGMNLDVRYAAPTAGTPLVLYVPHPSYNQHFGPTITAEGDLLLAPLHASTMCLTEVGNAVEIWPCNPAAPTQHLEIVDCADIPPSP